MIASKALSVFIAVFGPILPNDRAVEEERAAVDCSAVTEAWQVEACVSRLRTGFATLDSFGPGLG